MEEKLLEKIKKLGYNGEMTDPPKFSEAVKLGPKSTEFTKFVAWTADELSILNDLDETVHATASAGDASSFLLELSCFLKELGCMNQRLMTGNVNQRLSTMEDKYILLDYLCTELIASRIAEMKNLNTSTSMAVNVDESDTAKHLKEMLIALNFPKPPDNITPGLLFAKLENKLTEVLKSIPPEELGNPLIIGELSESQWKELGNIHQDLYEEYTMRRSMLLRRLDVTIQSFLWSESVKAREAELNSKYQEIRQTLHPEPNVTIADLLAARDDVALMEKASSANVRKNTRSKINSVMIGAVPDRGGRPYEQEPPPPEMPPWQKDRVPGPPSFRGGRGGGGGGGDRGSFRGGRGGGRGGGSGSHGGDNGANQAYATTSYAGGFSGGNRGYGNSSGGYGAGNTGGGYGSGNVGGGYGGNRGGYGGRGGFNGGDNEGYGHRYCYPSSVCGVPQADETREEGRQYQRGGGNGRGRGGRVQGGWNQGGNNSGMDGYQRGGYNRGRGYGGRQY